MKLSRLVKFFTVVGTMTLLVGCGRPASEQECQEILRRAAELELQETLGSKDLIEGEIKEIEKSMRETMMKKCVGKRITEGAMKCIRSAKSSDELLKKCF